MSIAYVDPGYSTEPNDQDVLDFEDALAALPPASLREVRRHLALVAIDYERHQDGRAVKHFIESLLMTARLHRNPSYREAMEYADKEEITPGEGADVKEYLAGWRERFGTPA